MKLPCRRRFLHLAASAAALPALSGLAWAQAYPSRPVRIVVGYTAGAAADTTARLIGQWLSERLGRPFVIENRPGAATNIATEMVVRAPPDGHTLLLVDSTHAINTAVYNKLNFDFSRDIMPVAKIMSVPNVMVVHPAFPAKTTPEFITYAKANPGKINMASAGNGNVTHLTGELFQMAADVKMVHIPYRGGAPTFTDLIGGQVQVYFPVLAGAAEYIRTGKLQALAVTSAQRSEALPDVPSMGEFLPGFESMAWIGIGVPKGKPKEIVEKLNLEINASFADPRLKARMADLGGTVVPASPAEFGKFLAEEIVRWSKVVQAAGIKPE